MDLNAPLSLLELESWLREERPDKQAKLREHANNLRKGFHGDGVHLRGLIELSNYCSNRCSYCGIGAEVSCVERYLLDKEQVLAAVERAFNSGCNTIVFQSGETMRLSAHFVAELILEIKERWGLSVTLSLGERKPEEFALWRKSGADRYLLRFETSDKELFEAIHPAGDSILKERLGTINYLRSLGFEVGSGVMVGIPGQTYASLAMDFMFFAALGLDMIGLGPYISHPGTPLGSGAIRPAMQTDNQVPATVDATCRALALSRIVCPGANIPATTALNTLDPAHGLEKGLSHGANVLMPNFTPTNDKGNYLLYPQKASISADSIPGRLKKIGRHVEERSNPSPTALNNLSSVPTTKEKTMGQVKPVMLVIDDDKDFVDATRLFFEGQGFNTRGVFSAAEAIGDLNGNTPDVILVDMMMEEVDAGPSLVHKLRTGGMNTPIFLLSSIGNQLASHQDAGTLGVDGILQKPVDYPALLRVIEAKNITT